MRFLNGVKNYFRETNLPLLYICLLTSAFGVLMVHSATLSDLVGGASVSRDVLVMIIAITMGVVCALIISSFDYEFIIRLWPLIAFVSLGLMVSLFKFGSGPTERADTISWLKIPIGNGFFFQPSELLKIAFIITFTMHADILKDRINDVKSIVQLVAHAAVPIVLVILTGDLGSALVFMVIFVGVMYIAGVNWRYFCIAVALAVTAIPILWINFLSDFQKQRFLAVYYPNGMTQATYNKVIYQQQQGINAIGSGGVKGTGLFEGVYTQNGLVPENENDMIFTVVGEELGLWGAILLLVLLFLVIFAIIYVGRKAKDNVSRLICYGVALMIAGQVVINIGMCLKLLPVIGITLPFMSAGGSSNLCIYLAIGLVLSVYRFNVDRAPVNFRLSRINTPFSD